MTTNEIYDEVTEAQYNLGIAKELTDHLQNIIELADTKTEASTALFFATNQSNIITLTAVISDYIADANKKLEIIFDKTKGDAEA